MAVNETGNINVWQGGEIETDSSSETIVPDGGKQHTAPAIVAPKQDGATISAHIVAIC